MNRWEEKALFAEKEYGAYVNWDKRFYICPECDALIYDSYWFALMPESGHLCPFCKEI